MKIDPLFGYMAAILLLADLYSKEISTIGPGLGLLTIAIMLGGER